MGPASASIFFFLPPPVSIHSETISLHPNRIGADLSTDQKSYQAGYPPNGEAKSLGKGWHGDPAGIFTSLFAKPRARLPMITDWCLSKF
ncbi:hypothetical protein BDQ94DRAFT_149492 [Aspergillus welwitschiae]|uniref:Uncharacterized protein n=1 Tax=Aspergillus welwitschiae TaxID=1341132 RepID=A0A3F3PSX3_9EURO|nr:hypothetical protein BDQ94DRAFT_149492 [Aspergillus welwitschiae]RDH30071.1 hypothetical protein BDQ94DRAFT_149492 [Aspergillus welwitschiae]